MNIKKYELIHQNEIEYFFKKIFEYMGFDWIPEQKDLDIKNINEFYLNKGGNFWILFENEKVIGTIALKPIDKNYAELKRFYILPDYQGKGYGKILIETLLSYARIMNYNFIRLDTSNKSVKAIKVFEKSGFYKINRYNDDIFAEIFMEIKLWKVRQLRTTASMSALPVGRFALRGHSEYRTSHTSNVVRHAVAGFF